MNPAFLFDNHNTSQNSRLSPSSQNRTPKLRDTFSIELNRE